MACYACASELHFGDDCWMNKPVKYRGPWSAKYAESMGWTDDRISRKKGGEKDIALSRGSSINTWGAHRGRGRDHDRDRDRDRDHGRDINRPRDIGLEIRGGSSRYRSRSPLKGGGGYRRDRRDRSRDRGASGRRKTPPPPLAPRSMLPPLPREPLPTPVGGWGSRERRGIGRNSGAADGRPLSERVRVMPSSGKREWSRFKS